MGNSHSQRTTLYDTLGVPKTASPEEITRAYRKLALKYHPDKNPGADEQFKEINHAKTILLDERRRRIYDSNGDMGLKMAEQLGEENLDLYLCLDSKLVKCCFVTLFCLTGCCCGCFFCCCCCCKCCCGLFAPRSPKEDYSNIRPEDIVITEEPVGQLDQPASQSESEAENHKEEDPLITAKHRVTYAPVKIAAEERRDLVMNSLHAPVVSGVVDPTDVN